MKEIESVCEVLWFENKWNNGNYPICQSKVAGGENQFRKPCVLKNFDDG
jgi:hypothetical protein